MELHYLVLNFYVQVLGPRLQCFRLSKFKIWRFRKMASVYQYKMVRIYIVLLKGKDCPWE